MGLIRIFIFLAFAFPFGVAHALTLEEAENLALQRNTELKVSNLEVEKSKLRRRKSFSDLLPRVNIEISLNLTREQSILFPLSPNAPPQELIFSRDLYEKYVLLFSQDIYNPIKLQEYKITDRAEKIQRLMDYEKKREVISKVREAYIGALKLKAVVDIYGKQEERVSSHLRDVKELYKQGLVAFKDVLETKVKLYEVREKLASARADYKKALGLLSYLLNVEVEEVDEVEAELPKLYELSLEELMEIAKKNRKLLKVFRERVSLSKEGVGLAKASFYPVLSLSGAVQYSRESNVFPNSLYFLSLSLRWNMFSGKGRFYALALAEKEEEIERLREMDVEGKVRLSLRNILEEIKAVRERLKLARVRLREAEEHLRIAREKYKAGIGTNTEVIDAQSYLISAQRTLKMNELDFLLLRFKLLEEIGYER